MIAKVYFFTTTFEVPMWGVIAFASLMVAAIITVWLRLLRSSKRNTDERPGHIPPW